MTDFVRVPADSAGKRVNTTIHNDGVNDIYTQVTHIGDRTDPDKHQSVTNKGEAKVVFDTGSPDFTVFGRTTVTESNLLGMYKFYQEDYSQLFYKEEIGGGTVARSTGENGLLLSCGTASGDRASYNSHRHYQYRPGNAMPLMFTMKANDTGKANLVRKAGWFGSNETTEVVFEMSGTSIYVVVSDTVLGTDLRVERLSWNGDRLDGTGGENNLSEATLDPLKNAIWWIDFQYLSAGTVRFGTYVNGKKVICHTMGNYGSLDRSWAQEAAFSFGVSQENTGITASSSEFVIFCGLIQNDGYDEFDKNVVNFSLTQNITSTTFVPIVSYRPIQTKTNGRPNRDRVLPQLVSVHTDLSGIELISEVNSPLTGATFAEGISNVEYDTVATATAGLGLRKVGQFIGAGRSEVTDLANVFPVQTSGITRHYLEATSDHVTVFARLISGATATDVSIGITVAEVQ